MVPVTSVEPDLAKQRYGPFAGNRGVQLVAGLIAMIVISNYQYAFTLFTPGMRQTFTGVPYSQIALIFSLFILFETWPVPVAGIFIDKFGIRNLMIVGSVGVLLGWLLGGTVATSVFHLYIFYGVFAGTGAGIIYIATVANAVKWFPDRRGLAAGLTAAGFGGGAALTLIPISKTISALGWQPSMALWGVLQGVIACATALILRHPPEGWKPAGWEPKVSKAVAQTTVNFTWRETIRRPEFYLLYVMFIMVCAGGLMTTGNLSEIAKSLRVQNATVLGISIVAFTATLTGITNAFSRIMWGFISDHFGRENTMTLAFAVEAFFIFLVTQIAGNSMLFILVLPFVFLSWGEIYALFSAITGDVFGAKNASANYGMLYTAKGVSSILAGWGAAVVAAAFAGSFQVPYYVAACFDLAAAILAFFALKPLVRGRIAREGARLQPAPQVAGAGHGFSGGGRGITPR
jgi:MFS transporter, OFA family, oxalate/formate antiporter